MAMSHLEGESPYVYQAKLDSSGRIVLPASIRERLGIGNGDSVLVVEEDSGFRILKLIGRRCRKHRSISQVSFHPE
jgi:AbrB family looped-hinge helix DNA binding protein